MAEEIGEHSPDKPAVVNDADSGFADVWDTPLAELNCERVLVDLLGEASAEDVVDAEGGADDLVGSGGEKAFVEGHMWNILYRY